MKGFKSATECLHCVADFAIQGEIDMEETKNLCIYTGKDETQAHFKNQEHIIPACIGGMQRLPKGYVSDEINTLFSGLELKLARNSPITLPRMFVGPGKRGSRNPKRRGGASKMVSVMQSNETGKYSLGYIRMGVPITIDQIQIVHMENGKHQVSLCFDSEDTDEKNFFEKSAEWMQKLQEFDGQATLMLTDGFPKNEVILGHESGRWYLAAATGTEAEPLKADLIEELKLLGKAYMQELFNQSEAGTQETKPSGMEGLGKLCKEKARLLLICARRLTYSHIIAWLQKSPSTALQKSGAGNMSCNRNLIQYGKQYLREKTLTKWYSCRNMKKRMENC